MWAVRGINLAYIYINSYHYIDTQYYILIHLK